MACMRLSEHTFYLETSFGFCFVITRIVWFVSRTNVYVPTGLAAFPNELNHCPESWAKNKYRNKYSYTFMPRWSLCCILRSPSYLPMISFSLLEKWKKCKVAVQYTILWQQINFKYRKLLKCKLFLCSLGLIKFILWTKRVIKKKKKSEAKNKRIS